MSAPVSSGMGQGAAQVFDTRGLVNTYATYLQHKQEQDARDQTAATKMLENYDAEKNKIRTQDMPEYNKMYTQLQDLYISNKGLYTNPMKHPEAYKKAQELRAEMSKYAAGSRAMTELSGHASKLILDPDKKDQLEDNVMGEMEFINKQPLSAIRTKYGQEPTIDLFKFKPVLPDMTKLGTDLHKYAEDTGGFEDIIAAPVSNEKNPNVPLGQLQTRTDRLYHPQALLDGVKVLSTQKEYRNLNKTYGYLYETAKTDHPDEITQMQEKLNTKLGGKTFEIKDKDTYMQAAMVLNYGTKVGESKFIVDEEYKRKKQEEADNKREATWQKHHSQTVQDQINRENRKEERDKNKPSTDQIDVDAATFFIALRDPKASSDHIQNISKKIVAALPGFAGKSGAPIVLTADKKKISKSAFRKQVNMWKATAYDDMSSANLSDAEIDQIYEDGGKIVQFPMKVEVEEMKNGEKVTKTVVKRLIFAPTQFAGEQDLANKVRTLGMKDKQGIIPTPR